MGEPALTPRDQFQPVPEHCPQIPCVALADASQSYDQNFH
jgi:hypothetical protein